MLCVLYVLVLGCNMRVRLVTRVHEVTSVLAESTNDCPVHNKVAVCIVSALVVTTCDRYRYMLAWCQPFLH